MLLNRLETLMMNNPVRAAVQRRYEGPKLFRMGGSAPAQHALELGCGPGIGAEVIRDVFGASRVEAFDLDPRMVARARKRAARRGLPLRLWVGDAAALAVPTGTYDAVFDFGIIHHVPDWRRAVREVYRVLRPGGRFFAEEVLAPAVRLSRHVLRHPQEDRFNAPQFWAELEAAGLERVDGATVGPWFAWFVARKPGSYTDR